VVDSKDTETKRKRVPFKWKNVVIILGLYFLGYAFCRITGNIVRVEDHGYIENGVIHYDPSTSLPFLGHTMWSRDEELIIIFYPFTKVEELCWTIKKPPDKDKTPSWGR